MIISRSIHVAANNIISLIFMTLYMYHIFSRLSSFIFDAHLGYFLVSAVVNRAAMYIRVHEFFVCFLIYFLTGGEWFYNVV